jgi:hypothetical protein
MTPTNRMELAASPLAVRAAAHPERWAVHGAKEKTLDESS